MGEMRHSNWVFWADILSSLGLVAFGHFLGGVEPCLPAIASMHFLAHPCTPPCIDQAFCPQPPITYSSSNIPHTALSCQVSLPPCHHHNYFSLPLYYLLQISDVWARDDGLELQRGVRTTHTPISLPSPCLPTICCLVQALCSLCWCETGTETDSLGAAEALLRPACVGGGGAGEGRGAFPSPAPIAHTRVTGRLPPAPYPSLPPSLPHHGALLHQTFCCWRHRTCCVTCRCLPPWEQTEPLALCATCETGSGRKGGAFETVVPAPGGTFPYRPLFWDGAEHLPACHLTEPQPPAETPCWWAAASFSCIWAFVAGHFVPYIHGLFLCMFLVGLWTVSLELEHFAFLGLNTAVLDLSPFASFLCLSLFTSLCLPRDRHFAHTGISLLWTTFPLHFTTHIPISHLLLPFLRLLEHLNFPSHSFILHFAHRQGHFTTAHHLCTPHASPLPPSPTLP